MSQGNPVGQAGSARRSDPSGPAHLLLLSAATWDDLEEATDGLAAELEGRSGAALAEVARALRAKPPLGLRRIVAAADADEAARSLRERDQKRLFTGQPRQGRPVVFLFSGVGDQYPGLAAGLYRQLPVFRRELDRCFELLEPELGVDVRGVLYPEGVRTGRGDEAGRLDLAALFDQAGLFQAIHSTLLAQPLVFAVQYALARSLLSLGIAPAGMLGYSVGEYVAACVAGVLPLEDALRLVALRARLVASLPEGAMLAVVLGAEPLGRDLDESLSVAALDGPELTVLSGPVEAIRRAGKRLADDGIACLRLATTHAFHSAMMEPVVEPLRELLAAVELRPPAIPFLSNVTGTWIRAEEATDPGYWARHLRWPIRFADDLAELRRLDASVLVELGAGRTLTRLAAQNQARPPGNGDDAPLALVTLPGVYESRPDMEVLLTAVGRLWATTGTEIEWPE